MEVRMESYFPLVLHACGNGPNPTGTPKCSTSTVYVFHVFCFLFFEVCGRRVMLLRSLIQKLCTISPRFELFLFLLDLFFAFPLQYFVRGMDVLSSSFSLDYYKRGYGSNRNKYHPNHDGAKTTQVIFHFKFSSCTFVVSI